MVGWRERWGVVRVGGGARGKEEWEIMPTNLCPSPPSCAACANPLYRRRAADVCVRACECAVDETGNVNGGRIGMVS